MTRLFAKRDADSVSLLTRAVALVYAAPLPALCRTERGKPYFPDRPDWHFSLAHSGPYVLCALSDARVGVDIECVRPRAEGLPEWVMSPDELAVWDGSWPGFFEVWTKKEAFGKYTGEGLRLPLREMAQPPGTQARCYAGEDWRAAVCCQGPPPGEIEWLFPGENFDYC